MNNQIRYLGLDLAPLTHQRGWGSLDPIDCPGVLDGLPGPLCRRGYTLLLAEGTIATDSVAGSAKHLTDFYADWQPNSSTENAQKSARMATRQTKNAKTMLPSDQKGVRSGQNDLKFDW